MAEEKKPDMPKVDSPESWRVECERAVFHANVLLRLAKIPGGVGSAIAEMIRTAPRSKKESEEVLANTLFGRIVLEAFRLAPTDHLFLSAIDYFADDLPAMGLERRRMLEASVTGAMMGFVMG